MSTSPPDRNPPPQLENIGKAAGGVAALLANLYKKYSGEICHYLKVKFGAGPPEPEDVVQQTFSRFASLDDPDDVRNPRAFLYKTAINIVIDYRRKEQRREELLLVHSGSAQEITDDRDPGRVLLGMEEVKILETAIMKLSERDRTFFLLNRMEGVSFAEIARRTGMSSSGVRLIVEQAFETCQIALQTADRKRRQP